jgi:hypothetical protein
LKSRCNAPLSAPHWNFDCHVQRDVASCYKEREWRQRGARKECGLLY